MTDSSLSRRDFARTGLASAAGALAATWVPSSAARASTAGARYAEIRVGLIGCGGRGTGAAANALRAAEGIKLVAVGDVFRKKAVNALEALRGDGLGELLDCPEDSIYDGLDAYKRVIEHPKVDVVLHAAPPGLRPLHLAANVAAGKHAFIEKPCCVDPVGYRSVQASAKLAREKGLSIVTGTIFRRSNNYVDGIRAIHEGALGDLLFAQARYCSGGIWYRDREPGQSDVEYQMNNWYHFTWLSGDQIVEQAVHNIDCINWVMGGAPKRAYGSGGQRVRPKDSEIYDHTAIDFEYPNGATCSFFCNQQPGKGMVWNRIVGTKGEAWIHPFGKTTLTTHGGETILQAKYKGDAYVQEHTDLFAALRAGRQLLELDELNDSTLTAVIGRLAAYTGEEVSFEWAAKESKLDTYPQQMDLKGALPAPTVAVPGRTKLV